jgi:6-phosphogluconolactonase
VNGDLVLVDSVPIAFAQLVASRLQFSINEKGVASLVLSGGKTAEACYNALAEHFAREKYPNFTRVNLFVGDERCVPFNHPDSNQLLIRNSLINKVGNVSGFYPMSCESGPQDYENKIRNFLPFDIVHLGLGPDGHTASLFSASAALNAAAGTLVSFNVDPSRRNIYQRMTLTLEAIAQSKLVVFTVAGKEKSYAFKSIKDGKQLPANMVSSNQIIWLVDAEANSVE